MAITDWPEGERPRERLLAHGPAVLSDAELLAIYLRVGVRGKSAVDLARDLLQRFDGQLTALVDASLDELASVSGIGMAKAAQLKASFELARRALSQEMSTRDNFSSPGKVRDWLRLRLANRPKEIFMALWLDAQNRLLWMWNGEIQKHLRESFGQLASSEEWHEILVAKLWPAEVRPVELPDGTKYRVGRAKTRTFNIQQMTTYLEMLDAYCAEHLGLLLPHPDELMMAIYGERRGKAA